MRRSAAGEHRWALTLFPTHALRERGGHVAARLRGLLLRRLPGHRRRPGDRLAAPVRRGQAPHRVDPGQGGGPHHSAAGTDITLGVAGRNWIPCVGEHNMPDGEFFTGPGRGLRRTARSSFSFPASYGGRTVSGVRFRFEDGKVVDASAEQGEDFLLEMLDTDDGARRLGELGIGTNYGIATGTKEILLDEKIGGTVHMAIGMSYPESGGANDSAVHWDMVCDLRRGGSITVDGIELQRDGKFLV